MQTERLRNFGILAHIDAGKTTLSECILFLTGAESRMGAVDVGTAAMDWHSEERERGITISAAVAHCPWREHRLQFVDTPGHVDFAAEVRRSLQVLDGAVVVIDALEGVQAQTYSVVRQAQEHNLPLLFVFNKMDRYCAEFKKSCEIAAEQLQLEIVPTQLAYFEQGHFCGVVDLLNMCLLQWDPLDDGADFQTLEIPPEMAERANDAHQQLCSRVAELNGDYEDSYLENSTLSAQMLADGIAAAVGARRWYPAFATSALQRVGGQQVLDAVVDYLPSPTSRDDLILHDSQTGKDQQINELGDETVAYVFKVERIARQDVAYVRLFAGNLASGQTMVLERNGQQLTIDDCFTVLADDLQSKATFVCGSLFVIKADVELQSGDTLRSENKRGAIEAKSLSSPVMSMRVEPPSDEQRHQLVEQCEWLCRCDPSLILQLNGGQIVLKGQGQLHLEIAAKHLADSCDFSVHIGGVMIERFESVTAHNSVSVNYAHFDDLENSVHLKLEVMPSDIHGIHLRFSPLLSELNADFVQTLYAAAAFEGWVGPAGYAIRALSLNVVELKFSENAHDINDLLVAALHSAVTQLLSEHGVVQKPFLEFEVKTPDSELSSVLTDLQARNASISAVEQQDGRAVVRAQAFYSDLTNYSTELRSQSHGRAELTIRRQSWKS
ncbi:MAG: GTP-binding protein [Planctomycetes bacterium]|nr:GTP-binding protein [Planctomycetota bacterium]